MTRSPQPENPETRCRMGGPFSRRAPIRRRVGQPALVLALSTALFSSGCTYHRAFISYEEQNESFPVRAEGYSEGQRLGIVAAKEGGPIWRECTSVAEGAVWVLIDEAQRKGGNAIGEIRWFPDDTELGDPTIPVCRKRWGFILLYPFLVTPLFVSAQVEAQVYRLPASALETSGLYVIPESVEGRSELVETILADATAPLVTAR